MSFFCPTSIQARSLWFGGIENWMDETYISQTFLPYGYKTKSVKIIRDKVTKVSSGYGFVEFESPDIAKDALNNLNEKPIQGSKKTFQLRSATYSAGKIASMGNFPKNEYSIYVGDLDQSVSEEKLREFFYARFKSVISAKIVIDTISKESKGFGFVQFNDQTESTKAIEEMNGKYLNGRQIKVNQASFKKFTEAMTNNNNTTGNEKNVNEVPLNQNTIKNLNNFYIQNTNDRQDAFNLSNFYCNHGKYFSGGNPYSMNNINDNINNENKKP